MDFMELPSASKSISKVEAADCVREKFGALKLTFTRYAVSISVMPVPGEKGSRVLDSKSSYGQGLVFGSGRETRLGSSG